MKDDKVSSDTKILSEEQTENNLLETPISVTKNGVIHSFSESESKGLLNKKVIILFLVILILGIASGNVLYNLKVPISVTGIGLNNNGSGLGTNSSIKNGQIFGSDEKTFKDTAEGIMREGGIDGEGAYHLERTGGVSQNVYMTSSIIDLSKFIGRKTKVWGETNSAKKAGWLMDVGRLQVLE